MTFHWDMWLNGAMWLFGIAVPAYILLGLIGCAVYWKHGLKDPNKPKPTKGY